MQLNFNNQREHLTQDDIEAIHSIVAAGTRSKNRTRLLSILTYDASRLSHFGIYTRLIKEDGQWSYVAGQSYTDEIRTLRDLILKCK